VDVWPFADGLILVRMEVEPIRPETMDDWHADLERVGGAITMSGTAYLAITS